MLFPILPHHRACRFKQEERSRIINELDPLFHERLTKADISILNKPVAELVKNVQADVLDPVDILTAYAKKTLRAHAETNCLTEIMISAAKGWARECNRKGPLAGVPISLKDTVAVSGWDACIGYSAWVGKPSRQDSAIVKLLRDAGAVPFVKTAIPITLLSFESTSDVFGITRNPHNKDYSPGGSSGGEGALLAYGGSRIGLGTDVAGSVRNPSHYSGVYTIKASTQRFLKAGNVTSMPGQEGIPAVYSPMARTLEDLETFWRAFMSMKPWDYDPSCLPIPWRDITFPNTGLRWGVIWDDGVVIPSPACHRALKTVVETLERYGHTVISVDPPSPYEGFKIASQLLLADAGQTAIRPIRIFERNDAGMRQAMLMFAMPRWMKKIYAWYLRYIRHDEIYAGLVEVWHEKTIKEFMSLIALREEYKLKWFEKWRELELDFILTVPNALPAVPHGGMKEGFTACGYTFLFNLLDYSAGVLPITHVDHRVDQLGPGFKPRNAIEAGAYKLYHPKHMDGLPVGVQLIGRRLEEEKVLEAMKLVESLLKREGLAYELLETDG